MKKYNWSKYRIAQWSYKVFPNLTMESQLKKLEEELQEAEKEYGVNLSRWRQEMADVSIVACILEERLNSRVGEAINQYIAKLPEYHLIMSARDEKMEINQVRIWGYEDGIYRHKE